MVKAASMVTYTHTDILRTTCTYPITTRIQRHSHIYTLLHYCTKETLHLDTEEFLVSHSNFCRILYRWKNKEYHVDK